MFLLFTFEFIRDFNKGVREDLHSLEGNREGCLTRKSVKVSSLIPELESTRFIDQSVKVCHRSL